jgi:hypothetical protein
MCDSREWLDCLCVVSVLRESACEHSGCAQVFRIGSEDLPCLLDSIVEFACLNVGGSQIQARAWDIFKLERSVVEFDSLGVCLFGHSQSGQLAKSYSDKALIC